MRAPLRIIALAVAGLASAAALAPPAAASHESPTVSAHPNEDVAPVSKSVESARLMAEQCKSFAGERITRPGYPHYLIDREGFRRGIPSPETRDRIFTDRNVRDFPVELCPPGEDLSLDAHLIAAVGQPTYLFTNGKVYGISSGGVMAKYHFDASKIVYVEKVVLDLIPPGGTWE